MCRFLVLPTIKGIRTVREYEQIAQQNLVESLGLTSSEWQLRVDPSSTIGVVICAVRHETMQLAKGLAVHLKQSVRSVQPWAAALLDHQDVAKTGLPPTVLLEKDAILLFAQDSEGKCHLRSLPQSAPIEATLAAIGIDAASVRWFEMSETAHQQPLRGDFLDLLVRRPL